MKFNPDIHRRRSIRLKGYDYSKAGVYFVTVCAWQRGCLFGEIVDGKTRFNEYGRIVENEWLITPNVRDNVELDYYIVMPNHFHGILIINDVGATRWVAQGITSHERAIHRIAPTKTLKSNTIGSIMGQFKSIVTKRINELRDNLGCPLWQRNYYEHIIRSDDELNRTRQYIIDNPLKWELDEENPANIPVGATRWVAQNRAIHRIAPTE
ncbi:MAG: transposase [Deltaproteobacteria bacterium]|nr:transposase [Deltaproteobacteria bacterium]